MALIIIIDQNTLIEQSVSSNRTVTTHALYIILLNIKTCISQHYPMHMGTLNLLRNFIHIY